MTFMIDRFWLGVIAVLLIEFLWAIIYYNRHKHDHFDHVVKIDANSNEVGELIELLSKIERAQNGEDNNNQGEQ